MKTFKKIILDDLKTTNLKNLALKIKSITYQTYAGGNSVNVNTVDLSESEREQLNAFLKGYQQGTFNGIEDIYENKKGGSKKERTTKFIFLNNTTTKKVVDCGDLNVS